MKADFSFAGLSLSTNVLKKTRDKYAFYG